MRKYMAENWVAKNPYLAPERSVKFNVPRFVMDTEVMSAEEMRQSSYYQGFMLPQQCYWHCGTSIFAPTGDQIKISVHRGYDEGPLPVETVNLLTMLHPHVARAALVASRLRFEQLRTAVDVLQTLGLLAGALRNGRLVLANEGLTGMIPTLIREKQGRRAFASSAANLRWKALSERGAGQFGGSFAVEATEAHPAMVVHLLPVAGAARDIFSVADMILVMTPAAPSQKIDNAILRALYDLTPAEAEIAAAIGEGQSLNALAAGRGLSWQTVRAQLRSVFEKTGTHRQADLARLIATLGR